jgi:predicted nucleic acid-binding protein
VILADTSVWIHHLRFGDPRFAGALGSELICVHPFVIGEIACGNLRNRSEILHLLGHLSALPSATDVEVLAFIENRALMGRGIGLVDVHLLASASIARVPIWTHDKRLSAVASELDLGYE